MNFLQVPHLRLTKSIFLLSLGRINHLKAHLMLLSRLVDSEVLWMSIQFNFFLTNRQNGECNVRNFRWFLFRMTPDPNIPVFKVRNFTSDIKFELEYE